MAQGGAARRRLRALISATRAATVLSKRTNPFVEDLEAGADVSEEVDGSSLSSFQNVLMDQLAGLQPQCRTISAKTALHDIQRRVQELCGDMATEGRRGAHKHEHHH